MSAFEASGEAGAAFCRRHHINVGSFSFWRWKIRQPVSRAPARVELLPVAIVGAPRAAAPRTVVVSLSGIELQVLGADADYVAELVLAIRSRC